MSHDFKKNKFLRKFVNLFGYKLIEKKFIKNYQFLLNEVIDEKYYLNLIFQKKKFKKLVHIGANDGETDDFVSDIIYKNNVKALLVEPLAENYEILKKKYFNHTNVQTVNCAISDRDGKKNFYFVENKNKIYYTKNINLIASFEISNLINYGVLKKHISCKTIDTLSLHSVLNKNDFLDFEILVLDVEGYDFHILKQLGSFFKNQPVICFEWVNFQLEDLKKVLDLFPSNYKFMMFSKDIISVPEGHLK